MGEDWRTNRHCNHDLLLPQAIVPTWMEVELALIVVITNKSDLAPVSDYNYEVLVGDGTKQRSKTIARGQVKGHRRDDGWKKLVQLVLEGEGA